MSRQRLLAEPVCCRNLLVLDEFDCLWVNVSIRQLLFHLSSKLCDNFAEKAETSSTS